jgi:hypothetical protein
MLLMVFSLCLPVKRDFEALNAITNSNAADTFNKEMELTLMFLSTFCLHSRQIWQHKYYTLSYSEEGEQAGWLSL